MKKEDAELDFDFEYERTTQVLPETKALCLGVLYRAVKDATNKNIEDQEKICARRWLFSEEERGEAFTFNDVCDWLGLDKIILRKKIFERIE